MTQPGMYYLRQEFLKTLRRPLRMFRAMNTRRLLAYVHRTPMEIRIGNSWTSDDSRPHLARRLYPTYEEYLKHQKSKLPTLDLTRYDVRYREVLRERLAEVHFISRGTSVLCLAARIGTEVRAFMDVGCFAVGIDLNPGTGNRYVLHGDFHDLQFPDESVDVVFTNSLDHVLYIDRLLSEVRRVLKPNGYLIIEAGKGGPGRYESFAWASIDDLVSLLQADHFILIRRLGFNYPWATHGGGEQLCLRKAG